MESTSFKKLEEALAYSKDHPDMVVLRNNMQCKYPDGAFYVRDAS